LLIASPTTPLPASMCCFALQTLCGCRHCHCYQCCSGDALVLSARQPAEQQQAIQGGRDCLRHDSTQYSRAQQNDDGKHLAAAATAFDIPQPADTTVQKSSKIEIHGHRLTSLRPSLVLSATSKSHDPTFPAAAAKPSPLLPCLSIPGLRCCT
jgi:hypothetical protein